VHQHAAEGEALLLATPVVLREGEAHGEGEGERAVAR
jgi:hypothetical protein